MIKEKMTNWDKVKEMMDVEEITTYSNLLCKTIQKMRSAEMCEAGCERCKEWLKQEYKPQILTDKEREYLSNVIKPFRNKVKGFDKLLYTFNTECIRMITEVDIPFNVVLPFFNKGEYYKNMEVNKEYTLEELGL